MKFKPANKPGSLLVELGPKEGLFPAVSSEFAEAPLRAFKLNRILVPVDFSECSKKALQWELRLLKTG